MIGMLFSLIRLIITSVLTVFIIYVILVMVDLVPQKFEPEEIFGDNYKQFNNMLKKDSESKSSTASVSGFFYRNLNHVKETASAAADQKNAAPAESSIMTPIDKTKKVINQYNESLQTEKQQLDNL